MSEHRLSTLAVKEGTFEWALAKLKAGAKLARIGWNGKDQFAYMVPASAYPAQTGVAVEHFGAGRLVPYDAYFALKGVHDRVSVWVPSTGDLVACDWYTVSLKG